MSLKLNPVVDSISKQKLLYSFAHCLALFEAISPIPLIEIVAQAFLMADFFLLKVRIHDLDFLPM